MAQKVSLIRGTLNEPDWIFCDEPTAGLDPVAAADMRRYLGEQRERGAALIVTTHVLGEAELMADRIAIMKRGRIVKSGTLDELRAESGQGRRFVAGLAAEPRDAESLRGWLREHTLDFTLEGDALSYVIPWDTQVAARGELAAALQRELSSHDAPFHELEEEQISLESVYLSAMAGKEEEDSLPATRGGKDEYLPATRGGKEGVSAPTPQAISGIPAREMFGSIGKQGRILGHALPFYVSSWWRRGDLSWVMYLNASSHKKEGHG